ncbi:hypothetical protein D9613_009797 [Agrocybe pediades]|uniref:Nephrocystin 3-like N-terminal domain-containing protein n=1 Tax=Agrocybe pediades TaxID=84607 RepID=A0A8H4VQ05_9AGAR|nr:hypothetical protein D9613_009797 [Agrocybe pediades]
MAFFRDLEGDAHVYGGTFNHADGDLHFYQIQEGNHNGEQGLQTLSREIAAQARHDHFTRFSAPRCHPGTMKAVLDIITSWIEEDDSDKPCNDILWLTGTIGSGKTTISQTLADSYSSGAGRRAIFAGSFFFSREAQSDLEEANILFATLAYQLALYVPGLREHVNYAMILDPTLHTRDICIQWNTLIVEPLQRLEPLSVAPFVIIDGLDGCRQHGLQRRIIELIAEDLSTIPLRCIITSRPEAHIHETFRLPQVATITRTVRLESFNAIQDIQLFLRSRFKDILRHRRDISLPPTWPDKADFDTLANKSGGQFSYAAVVMDFIAAEDQFPDEQLKLVLQSSSEALECYSEIDRLYMQILRTGKSRQCVVDILSHLLVYHCPQPPEVYEALLGYRKGKVRMALQTLHSVVKVPHATEDQKERKKFQRRAEYDQTRGLRLHSASFREFLRDTTRCPMEFRPDLEKAHAKIVKSGFELMMRWICSPWSTCEADDELDRDTLGYLKHHIHGHLKYCSDGDRASVIKDLRNFKISFPPTKASTDPSWDRAFHALHSLLTSLAKVLSDGSVDEKSQYINQNVFHSEHSHWAQEHVWNRVGQEEIVLARNEDILEIYLKYQNILDQFYHYILSSSSDMLQFLDKLPGFATQKHPAPIERAPLEDIFEENTGDLSSAFQKNRNLIHVWYTKFGTRDQSSVQGHREVVLLNPHFSSFLRDASRAGKFYKNPRNRYTFDLQRTIRMITRPDWLKKPRSALFLSTFVPLHFHQSLNDFTFMKSRKQSGLVYLDDVLKTCFSNVSIDPSQNYASDDPMLQLMDVISNIVYEPTILSEIPSTNVGVIWSMTRRLLDWLEQQLVKFKITGDKGNNAFRKRISSAIDGIYQQILEVDSGVITIRRPFLVLLLTCSPPGTELPPTVEHGSELQLSRSVKVSETLLTLHGTRNSLASFLTKKKRAGKLYISSNIYHEQMAEICLCYCDPSVSNIITDWKSVPAYTEWRFHLERAPPSERILTKLANIPIGQWLAGGLPSSDRKAKMKSIQSIIAWLAKSYPQAAGHTTQLATDVHDRWHQISTTLKRFNLPKTVSRLTIDEFGESSSYLGSSLSTLSL